MAPWVPAFTNSVNRHLESFPFVTLSFATVDCEGRPKVRTCIYRGFLFNDRRTNVLTITSDTRMDKIEHLKSNSQVEACFWFPKTNEQFRVSGHAHTLTSDNAEKFSDEVDYPLVSPGAIKNYSSNMDLASMGQMTNNTSERNDIKPTAQEWKDEMDSKWDALSGKLKASFRKPEPGSKITPEKRKLLDSITRGVDGSNEEDGKKNYSLVVLTVDKVDYINLNGHNDIRYLYERFDEDQWTEDEVCP